MVTKNKYSKQKSSKQIMESMKQIRLSLLLITARVTFILFNREKKGKKQ